MFLQLCQIIFTAFLNEPIIITEKSKSLSEIVRGFKTFSARRLNQMRKTRNVPVGQRNYYEHILRDERALEQIRRYIQENPQRWEEDTENPIFGFQEKYKFSKSRAGFQIDSLVCMQEF